METNEVKKKIVDVLDFDAEANFPGRLSIIYSLSSNCKYNMSEDLKGKALYN